jgi:tetratricopeptide (TPR) repeat protein
MRRRGSGVTILSAFAGHNSNCSNNLTTNHTIEVDANDLKAFVSKTLAPHLHHNHEEEEDEDMIQQLNDFARELADHYNAQHQQLCNFSQQRDCPHCSKPRWDDFILKLQAAMASNPELPAPITADVHSWIGLLRQKQGDFAAAIPSYLKALWIHSSLALNASSSSLASHNSSFSSSFSNLDNTTSSSRQQQHEEQHVLLQIALTEHRLGLAYGKSGRFADATKLLHKALKEYDNLGLHAQEPVYVSCRSALADFEEALRLEQTLVRDTTSSEPTSLTAVAAAAHRPQRTTSNESSTSSTSNGSGVLKSSLRTSSARSATTFAASPSSAAASATQPNRSLSVSFQ